MGALFVRQGTPIEPAQTGGKQENGLRAGTHNVPLIVGMAEALRLAQTNLEERASRYQVMRDNLIQHVCNEIPRSRLTGHPTHRLPNHASFAFEGVDGNQLMMMLDIEGFACSSGSACKTGSPQPSEVLTAIGLSRNWALGSLRVSMGRETTPEIIENFSSVLPGVVSKLRSLNT